MHLVVPPGGSFRETRRIELGARVLTIGRAEACDVRVDVPGVDDEHAKIGEGALTAVGNDCAVGDVPLDAGCRRLVIPGDEIQIGSVVLAVDGVDPNAVGEAQRRPPGPCIRVVEGPNAGAQLVLAAENQEYVIGRSPKADLVLEDREVSREHIKIVRRGFTIFLFDAASTRGSWLGRSAVYQGSRVQWERPRMLKLGATVLSLELPIEVRQRDPAAQVSAPMTAPPRQQKPKAAEAPADLSPLPPGADPIVAYHYAAAPKPELPSIEASSPVPAHVAPATQPGVPGLPGLPLPPLPSPSQPPMPMPMPMPMLQPSVPSPTGYGQGPRAGWKKGGVTIGRMSGLLLLGIAGIVVLGVLFVVFSLME